MGLDLFRKGFDEGTRVKLNLFYSYLRQWLPTLTQNEFTETLNIFDFFAGAGKDKDGHSGSPLLSLDVVSEYAELIRSKGVRVCMYLNDDDAKKVESLEVAVAEKMTEELSGIVQVAITCKKFEALFGEYLPLMKRGDVANFLFLDQHGISEVTKSVFSEIVRLEFTDFMFFIASETFNRFGHVGRTQQHLEIPPEQLMATQHNHIHRVVTEHYRSLIPVGEKFYLAPFSIKKPDTGNIYGLVFGSGHLAGLQKFLSVAWSLDGDFGEANYDVDGENVEKGQEFLFADMKKPTKQELFAEKLRMAFEKRQIATDYDLLEFTLTNGFQAKHAKDILSELFDNNVLPKQKISLSFSGRWQEHVPITYN